MTRDGGNPLAQARRARWRAQWARFASWRRASALLCALVSVLSLTLSACANVTLPSGVTPTLAPQAPTPDLQAICHTSSEAGPSDIGFRVTVTPPIASDGVVYVGYPIPGANGYPLYLNNAQYAIAALRASDGTTLWRVPVPDWPIEATPLAVENGVLIVRGERLMGLRASDGAILWQAAIAPSRQSVVTRAGVLYATSDTDTPLVVYAIQVTDGRVLWQTPVIWNNLLSAPVLDGNALYFGSGLGFLIALRVDTGAVLWTSHPDPTHPAAGVYTPLGVVGGWLYVYTNGGLLRMNPADGASEGYALSTPAATQLRDPMMVDGIFTVGLLRVAPVGVTLDRPDIAAYRLLASGNVQLLWRLPANGMSLHIMVHDTQTLYLDEAIYGHFYAVRPTDGAILWRLPLLGAEFAGVDADGGRLFESASGTVDICNPWQDRAPQIRGFVSAQGGGSTWTRTLDATR